jgi:hypothetical protein
VRWLREPAGGDDDGDADPARWDRWLLRLLNPARVLDVDGVLVDRRVLGARFACVAERCVGPARGSCRSCCADVAVGLARFERRALRRHQAWLVRHLRRHEPGLRPWLDERRGQREVFVDGDGNLARPQGRCVFSRLDAEGAIRCRLRTLARACGLPRLDLQPLSCALFPLLVVETSPGRLLLSLVTADNHRLLGHHPPRRYPCLDDVALPPLVQAMRGDLEVLLGRGATRALLRAGAAELSRGAAPGSRASRPPPPASARSARPGWGRPSAR